MLRLASTVLLLAVLCGCDILAASRVESAVKKALGADPRTASLKFEVACEEGGAVSITGEVDTDAELAAVKEIAAKVPGVTSVVNNCHVKEEGSGMIQDDVAPML